MGVYWNVQKFCELLVYWLIKTRPENALKELKILLVSVLTKNFLKKLQIMILECQLTYLPNYVF